MTLEAANTRYGIEPDRLFRRTTLVVLVACSLLVGLSQLSTVLSSRQEDRAMQLALTSGSQALSARQIAADLEKLAELPRGVEFDGLRAIVARELNSLLAREQEKSGLIDTDARLRTLALAAPNAVREIVAEMLAVLESDAHDPLTLAQFGNAFERQIIPHLSFLTSRFEAEAYHARSSSRWRIAASSVVQIAGVLILMIGVVRPAQARLRTWVDQVKENERESRFRLLHDPMTNMPNDAYLRAYLERISASENRSDTATAVFRIDLDRFRSLRETLGLRAANEIVCVASRRINQSLRGNDFAAYLGNDDFVVVATKIKDENNVATIAQKLQTALSMPYAVGSGARKVGCSIGVTLLSDDDASPARILGNAEIALNEAQAIGSGNIRYFRESLRIEMERREALFAELSNAIVRGELTPHFQPQISLTTGAFCGFEALVRWHHPNHGLLEPSTFLDFAEETDLTERVGEAVLAATLEALVAWDKAGLNVPRVGVNFALSQLRNPRLIEKIKWEVERFDIEPSRISIEVLETVLIKNDADLVVRNLNGLASAGFEVELDDFGTGHASISNLRRFPVERIKIDRSFIRGIEISEEQQKLTASMIAMAQALGIQTLAEGVETPEAEETLRSLGCDFCQGYLISKPISVQETFDWLRATEVRGPLDPGGERPMITDPNTP